MSSDEPARPGPEADQHGVAGGADQSRPACQSRLQQAQACDQVAAQMLRTGQVAYASQPEPGRPGQASPAAGNEAGQ
jgi:hypothetical protein